MKDSMYPTPGGHPATTPELLDVKAVAAMLGCSARHVSRMADLGRMPDRIKFGALTRWRRADVEQWIADGCPAARVRGVR